MSKIRNTGVFATPEEAAKAREKADALREAPMIHLTPNYVAMVDRLADELMAFIDECAQAHGLPPPGIIDGQTNHYGMLATGELTQANEALGAGTGT